MSGYDIKKLVEASVSNFWTESYGQIYPILRRLEAEGLARQTVEEGDGHPDRHVYSLTPAGRRELERWLGEPARADPGRIEILLKLFFARQVGVDDARSLLAQHRAQLADQLAAYEALEAALHETYAGQPDLPYWLMTVRYGIFVKRALLQWSDESLSALPGISPAAEAQRR
jgi:DNA-binding PadR family transcriptional regulator